MVLARSISLTGTNMTTVALPWFVLATTGSTAKMGLVLACQTLPSVVLGVPAGAVVARVGARRFMVIADGCRGPLLALVPILHGAGLLSFPALLVVVTVVGVFAVPYSAAATALLPQLVGEDERELTHANAALQVAIQTTGVVGPVLAGVLIPPFGASNVLYLDAVSYALSATVVLLLVPATHASGQTRLQWSRLLAGVRWLFDDEVLRSIVSATLLAHLAMAALFASLPALAFRQFHDARLAGVMFAADAVGSVLGGLLTMRLARRAAAMALGLAGFAAMSAGILLLALSDARPVAVAAMFVFGLGGPLGVAPLTAVLTGRTRPDARAQTVSAFFAVSGAGAPVGAGGAGWLIARAGFAPTYAVLAVSMAVATMLLTRTARLAGPLRQSAH
jgi:MFS family permease